MTVLEIQQALDRVTAELKKPGALIFSLLKQREQLLKQLEEATALQLAMKKK